MKKRNNPDSIGGLGDLLIMIGKGRGGRITKDTVNYVSKRGPKRTGKRAAKMLGKAGKKSNEARAVRTQRYRANDYGKGSEGWKGGTTIKNNPRYGDTGLGNTNLKYRYGRQSKGTVTKSSKRLMKRAKETSSKRYSDKLSREGLRPARVDKLEKILDKFIPKVLNGKRGGKYGKGGGGGHPSKRNYVEREVGRAIRRPVLEKEDDE